MSNLLHIAERILNRPLLIHPDKLGLILSALEGRLPVTFQQTDNLNRIAAMPELAQVVMRGPDASQFEGTSLEDADGSGRLRSLPYRRTESGTAVLSIVGSLVNRGAWLGAHSGMVSYEAIKFQVQQAVRDPHVKNIVLDIESPGGEAVGITEAAGAVREAAKIKPVIAVTSGMNASGAYWLSSQASRVVVGETSVIGSIGVVLAHQEFSAFLEKQGIATTLIYAGEHKVDGNPFEPLPDSVRDDLKAEVDMFYEQFVSGVAKGRAVLSKKQIRSTEARTYIGKAAVDVGLADSVGTFEQVLWDLSRSSRRSVSSTRNRSSTMNAMNAMNAIDLELTLTDEQRPTFKAAIEAARQEGLTAGRADGLAEGRSQALARISDIIADERVDGREAVAMSLAIKSPDMSAADVVDFVSTAVPKQSKVPSVSERSSGVDTPNVNRATHKASWDSITSRINQRNGF